MPSIEILVRYFNVQYKKKYHFKIHYRKEIVNMQPIFLQGTEDNFLLTEGKISGETKCTRSDIDQLRPFTVSCAVYALPCTLTCLQRG